jgi:hypothetical protein
MSRTAFLERLHTFLSGPTRTLMLCIGCRGVVGLCVLSVGEIISHLGCSGACPAYFLMDGTHLEIVEATRP